MSATKEDMLMVIDQYLSSFDSRIDFLESRMELLVERLEKLEKIEKLEPKSETPTLSSVPAPSIAGAEVVTPSPVEPLLQVPQRSLIAVNDPMPENLSKLAGDLKSVGVIVNLVTLAEWSRTRHDVARAWLEQGAKKDDRPEFLPAPKPEQVDLLAALKRSVAAAKKPTAPF